MCHSTFGRHPADVRDPVDEVNLRNRCRMTQVCAWIPAFAGMTRGKRRDDEKIKIFQKIICKIVFRFPIMNLNSIRVEFGVVEKPQKT